MLSILAKLLRSRSAHTAASQRRPASSRRFILHVEELETRLAPAKLLNSTTVVYRDVDGDKVQIKISKPLLNDANVNSVFFFNQGSVDDNLSQPQHLDLVNLVALATPKLSLSVTAVPSPANGGNGFANVGAINALALDVGSVLIDGDLSHFDAGDNQMSTVGLASLTVESLGRFTAFSNNTVQGRLGKLTVNSDMIGVVVNVLGGADATIGQVKIGGSLIGSSQQSGGSLISSGAIGPVFIGGDLQGGSGFHSGEISGPSLASLTVGGSIVGGSDMNSGDVLVTGNIGPILIGGNLRGGSGEQSGFISGGNIASLLVGGSIVGGNGDPTSGAVSASQLGKLQIKGDLLGGDANSSGSVTSSGFIGDIKIGGAVVGKAASTARISAGTSLGKVFVGRDVVGGGANSAIINATNGNIAAVTIGGAIIGGLTGNDSAVISSGANIGPIIIGGNLQGGGVLSSGRVSAGGSIAQLRIGGSLIGGAGQNSGRVVSDGRLGPVSIGRDIVGGAGNNSGCILTLVDGSIAKVAVAGSIYSGTGTGAGGIRSSARLGPVSVTGNLVGASTDVLRITASADIASLTVGGRVEWTQILGGYDINGTGVNADAQIGAVLVGKGWHSSSLAAGVDPNLNGFANADDTKLAGGGVTDVAATLSRIAKIEIKGQVSGPILSIASFGFVAEKIGSLKIHGVTVPLNPGAKDDLTPVALAGFVAVREV